MIDDSSARPTERYEKDKLFLKKMERMDIHLKKLEAMIHKNALQMKQILLQERRIYTEEKKIQKGIKVLEKEEDQILKLERKKLTEELELFDKKEKQIARQESKLAKEEKVIEELILVRREHDTWFSYIMHDCPSKHIEKSQLRCSRNNKICNFPNCPRKKELKVYLK